jgi:plastocyanin
VRSQAAGPAKNRSLLTVLGVALALGLVALAGCGSSSSSTSSATSTPASTATTTATTPPTTSSATQTTAPPGGAAQTLTLAASPEGQLKFTSSSLTAKAGKVTINFENKAPVEHNVTVASSSGAVLGATPTFMGGSKTLMVTLKAGTYKFYCSVPGHRQAGMEGTLEVK